MAVSHDSDAGSPDATHAQSRPPFSGDWPLLKSLWFSLDGESAEAQRQHLAALDIAPDLRAQLARMLDAVPQLGERFDAPAHVALGFGGADVIDRPSVTLVGQRLGPYRVIRLVGHGGMGAVYEAQRDDDQYQQRVAIKTLWRGADSTVLLQRFRSERQILAALQHPNIAQLIDGGATETGTPWLAMEYVDGVAIDRYCDERKLSLAARLDLFRAVCHAVQHAHQRLVVHRDLKPANVLVSADGTVKLLDFGVAKLLDDGENSGTLTGEGLSPFTAGFAAPEQARGELTSTATDVYALGALLCVLLAGAPPLDVSASDPVSRLLAVRDGITRAPSDIARGGSDDVAQARGFESARRLAAALTGELDAIVAFAVRRDAPRRYNGAQALSDDVLRYLRRDRVLARRDTLRYRSWAFARRHRALVFGTGAGMLTILAVGVMSLRQAQSVRAEAARSERAAAFMAGIMSGPSMTSQDPMIRIGAVGTVAQLLDSAVLRIPREFAGDDRIRARLYTAFGANFATQLRYGPAHATLDSARALAAKAYGVRSLEYGNASLELAALELQFVGPAAADEALTSAEQSDASVLSTLRPRTIVLRAKQALSRGQMRRADSLAQFLLESGGVLTVGPAVRVSAEGVRMSTSSWLRRDPREYLRRARAIIAQTESLGMRLSNERYLADAAEVEALLVLGRAADAEARVREGFLRLRAVIGLQPMLDLEAARSEALLAQVRGDTAARRIALEQGWNLLQRSSDIPFTARLLFSNSVVDDALFRRDTAMAVRAAEQTRSAVRSTQSAVTLVFAHLYVGVARLAEHDALAAERALREGLDIVRDVPDLASMGARLRRPLAEALTAQGRVAEADSVRRLDPPKAAMPPCTPGGKWAGCPDR